MRNSAARNITTVGFLFIGLLLAGSASLALAAEDRSALKVPDGLSFSEIKGYENWADIAVSQTEDSLKAIVGNAEMLKAYRAGIPGDGKSFPDGSKVVKIEWSVKKNAESPYFVMVPDALKSVAFIIKDSKRFPNTSGWGYAKFDFDKASGGLKPSVTGTACGYMCHTAVKAKDYIFTGYPPR